MNNNKNNNKNDNNKNNNDSSIFNWIFEFATLTRRRCILIVGFSIGIISFGPNSADCHGFLIDPAARNSLWRLDSSAPKNYDDNQLFCGGIGAMSQTNGKCGVCGDPFNGARIHETGGYMATNRTVKNFYPGSTAELVVDLDTNHGGTFQFQICWRDSFKIKETEECFEDLELVNGEKFYQLKRDHSENGIMVMSVNLPVNKTCKACIIRWDYRAGNNWGRCPDGRQKTGCGLQELYRNCADVSIRSDGFGIGLSGGRPNDNNEDDINDDDSFKDTKPDSTGYEQLWRNKRNKSRLLGKP